MNQWFALYVLLCSYDFCSYSAVPSFHGTYMLFRWLDWGWFEMNNQQIYLVILEWYKCGSNMFDIPDKVAIIMFTKPDAAE